MMFRQGDVALIPSNRPPPAGKAQRVVLVRGASTGNTHVLANAVPNAVPPTLVHVLEATTLDHPEHSTINIPAGVYDVRRQIEGDDTQVED